MSHVKKPAIPAVPREGALRDRFDQALKENIEIFRGIRVTPIAQLENTQERWMDLLAELSAGKAVGANAPTWTAYQGGISMYAFDAGTMNEVWANFHVTHDYKMGTKMYPHIHWQVTGTNAGVVRWGVEYTLAKGHGQGADPATTTVYVEQAATGTAFTNMIAEMSDANAISGELLEPDAVVKCRFFRDAAHVNDTQTGKAFVSFVDLHYQTDGNATTTKAPQWVKNMNEHGIDTFDRVNELLARLQD